MVRGLDWVRIFWCGWCLISDIGIVIFLWDYN